MESFAAGMTGGNHRTLSCQCWLSNRGQQRHGRRRDSDRTATCFARKGADVASASNGIADIANAIAHLTNGVVDIANAITDVANGVADIGNAVADIANGIAEITNRIADISNT